MADEVKDAPVTGGEGLKLGDRAQKFFGGLFKSPAEIAESLAKGAAAGGGVGQGKIKAATRLVTDIGEKGVIRALRDNSTNGPGGALNDAIGAIGRATDAAKGALTSSDRQAPAPVESRTLPKGDGRDISVEQGLKDRDDGVAEARAAGMIVPPSPTAEAARAKLAADAAIAKARKTSGRVIFDNNRWVDGSEPLPLNKEGTMAATRIAQTPDGAIALVAPVTAPAASTTPASPAASTHIPSVMAGTPPNAAGVQGAAGSPSGPNTHVTSVAAKTVVDAPGTKTSTGTLTGHFSKTDPDVYRRALEHVAHPAPTLTELAKPAPVTP